MSMVDAVISMLSMSMVFRCYRVRILDDRKGRTIVDNDKTEKSSLVKREEPVVRKRKQN